VPGQLRSLGDLCPRAEGERDSEMPKGMRREVIHASLPDSPEPSLGGAARAVAEKVCAAYQAAANTGSSENVTQGPEFVTRRVW
jgi:hypothetical protein